MLHQFLTENREELVRRMEAKVAVREVPEGVEAGVSSAVSLFLDQLVTVLQRQTVEIPDPRSGIAEGAARHGRELQRMGCTVSQVVQSYGDICQSITELATSDDLIITAGEFNTLNRSLDIAIAGAVTEYGRQQELNREHEENERLGVLAHEHRNLLFTAMLAFQTLQEGRLAIDGTTGAVLGRSLASLRTLNNRTLAHVRVAEGLHRQKPIVLADFIAEEEVAAVLEARQRGVRLKVAPVPKDLAVAADRLVLGSALANLLQNAFKFSRPEGEVQLRVLSAEDRVLIEIEDECGGLQPGEAGAMFSPFHQRRDDRTGLGLGLSIVRKAVEESGGRIAVRDLPGRGCVFTVDLPGLPA